MHNDKEEWRLRARLVHAKETWYGVLIEFILQDPQVLTADLNRERESGAHLGPSYKFCIGYQRPII